MRKRSSGHYILKVIVRPRGAAGCQFVLALPAFLILALPIKSDLRPPLDAWLTTERGDSYEGPATFHSLCGLIPRAGRTGSLQVLTRS